MPSFEEMAAGYANMWRSARVEPGRVANVKPAVHRIIRDRKRYEAVEASTGVPWFWIAAVHDREASGSFAGVLHNGEAIIGTGRKTTLVPKGRGPFATWEEAAADALGMKGLPDIDGWSIERMLYEFERFNGMGYVSRGQNSPYVWADTNHEQLGKFVADGRYDPSVDDQQRGCAAILLMLCERDAGVRERVNGKAPAKPATPPKPASPGQSWVVALVEMIAALFGRGTPVSSPVAKAADAVPAWHLEARKDLGFRETGTNHGIDAFIRDGKCGADGDPYCAIAANAWLERAGIPGTRSAMARSFETSKNFVRLSGPALGAIMTFWRVSKASGSGHVGQYAGEDATGPICLGANQQDGVNYAHADMSRSTGFWWPKGQPLPPIGPVKVSGIKALAAGKEV